MSINLRPIDPDTGKTWPAEKCNHVKQRFWREARDELNEIDEERSGGRICAATGWKVTQVMSTHEDKDGNKVEKLAVNEELSRLKHTGRDRRKLASKKWLEFISEPRREADFEEFVAIDRKQQIEKLRTFVESKDEVPEPVIA